MYERSRGKSRIAKVKPSKESTSDQHLASDITKLPSPKKLEAEYAQLASEKAKFYEQYKEAKEELLKLKTAKQNVAFFFREEEQTQQVLIRGTFLEGLTLAIRN